MKRGFTLIELSVVLAILSVVMAGGLSVLTVNLQQQQYDDTVDRMAVIEKALLDYTLAFGRLPCPADLSKKPTDTYYGSEAGSSTTGTTGTGECVTGMTPAANYKSSTSVEEGAVPTRTLQLPDSYMYDSWGRKFRYAVDPNYTGLTFYSKPPFPNGACYTSTKSITVKDAAGATRTSNAVYVLWSSGANGHSGWTKTGGRMNAYDLNTDELANCHCASDGTDNTGSYTLSYVQHTPSYTNTHANDSRYRFDDLVAFRIPWQLQSQSRQVSSACKANTFLWVADGSNNRIVKFDTTTGSYVTSISSSTSPSFSFTGPGSVAVDSSGNIWVADAGNRVIEFDSSGNWKKTLGGGAANTCAGTASGASCSVITLYDGTSNSHCCVPNSGSCSSCTAGGATGQFDTGGAPVQMAFDSSGNLWVTDYTNNRLQEFNTSTGAWMQTVPTTVGPPSGIVIDSGGTIWMVVEGGSKGLYKYSGGVITLTSSSLNGAGWSSNYAAIDNNGYIWATDEGNNKVKQFSAAGVYLSNYLTLTASGGYQNTGIFFDSQGYAWMTTEDTNKLYQVNPSNGSVMNTISTANGIGFGSPQLSFSNAR